MFQNILYLTLSFIFLEILILILFKSFKKNFQWLISNEDINPKFSKKKFNNFLKNSFDKKLGWDRKASTSGHEISNRKTFFTINQLGFRGGKKFKVNKMSVFGDSFAFCRYVNNHETWEHHLSKKIKGNVSNYGVGNYGLDQAFLKYLRYKKKLKNQKIIFCVVPETIARVFSYWKHFREYKNIFAIKPFIKISSRGYQIYKIPKLETNIINKNYLQFDKIFLKKVIKEDIFFNLKFKKNIFKFPYSISFTKRFLLNSKIFYYLILHKINSSFLNNNNNKHYNLAYSSILQENIIEAHNYYEKIYFKKNFKKFLNFLDNYFNRKKIKYKILIVPQYYDLKSNNTRQKYIKFYKNLENPNIIDLSDDILKTRNWSKYFFKNSFGGHLNKSGNKMLSNIIYKKLKI